MPRLAPKDSSGATSSRWPVSQPLAGLSDTEVTQKHGVDAMIPEWLDFRRRYKIRAQPLVRVSPFEGGPKKFSEQQFWHVLRPSVTPSCFAPP